MAKRTCNRCGNTLTSLYRECNPCRIKHCPLPHADAPNLLGNIHHYNSAGQTVCMCGFMVRGTTAPNHRSIKTFVPCKPEEGEVK